MSETNPASNAKMDGTHLYDSILNGRVRDAYGAYLRDHGNEEHAMDMDAFASSEMSLPRPITRSSKSGLAT